jgi:outer membrane protein insertion porin family
MLLNRNLFCLFVSCGILLSVQSISCDIIPKDKCREIDQLVNQSQVDLKGKILKIKDINISGNKHVRKEVILSKIPYKVGDVFDESSSALAINNLYELGHFRQIQIDAEILDDNNIVLFLILEEKKLVDKLEFHGNKVVKTDKIKEKLAIDKLVAIDQEAVTKISDGIEKLYREENRHLVKVDAKLVDSKEHPDKASAFFTIHDGPTSKIKRVNFIGNKNIPSRKLSKALFTRENWLFSFMDSAGSFQEDALEMDKHRLEYFYRDHGYLTVKVVKTDVSFSKDKKDIDITFHLKEGNQYTVKKVDISDNDLFPKKQLEQHLFVEENQPYSQSKVVQTINSLKDLLGSKGYIYADVYPQIKPDEKTSDVDVTFHLEKGNKLFANNIVVTGNEVTRDKVIRRQLDIVEGDLITTQKLNSSKNSVEYLGFFERESVVWKLHRVSDDLADLEMNVKEAKTGNFNFQLTYGSDTYNPRPSLRAGVVAGKNNLFGKGYDFNCSTQFTTRRRIDHDSSGKETKRTVLQIKKMEANLFDPHLFDTDVSGAFFFYKRWDEYDYWRTDKTPIQKVLGTNMRLGFRMPKVDKRMQILLDLGIEDIKNNNPRATGHLQDIFEPIVRRTFQEGTLSWVGVDLVKDTRNHPVYPNTGYKLTISTKTAPAGINDKFGFFKVEAQGSCYNSLIGVDFLVLAMQLKLSGVRAIGKNKIVPYKDLFHMGGQTTVRGFTWGGIGPAWGPTGDPLGAQNALQFNTELIFPIDPSYAMKGHVFYDSGAGWNTPRDDINDLSRIKRNSFSLRHSVGFGVNLTNPMPAKIDWGFKLDRRKRDGESAHEFHLSMNYAW